MDRAALDPFYERAHRYCDLGAYRYGMSDVAPGDPELRLLPDNPEVETAVLRQSAPTRFGKKYRDVLAASESVHVWLWTNAVRVSTRSEAGREIVETRTLDGHPRTFKARAVVLAPGAIEATRLLLWSNELNGTSAGDAGGLLGRCYMDHPSGGAAFVHFRDPQPEKLYWTDIKTHADEGVPLHFVWRMSDAALSERGLPNFHYFVIPFGDDAADQARRAAARRSIGSLKRMAKWVLGRDTGGPISFRDEYCTFATNADSYVAERAVRAFSATGHNRALLKYEAEQRPDRENALQLDPAESDALGLPRPILRWAPSRDDMAAVRETAILFGQFVGAAGLGRLELEDHGDDPYWGTTTAWHQLGTMRMAESPTAGVVDADCRVHGAGALYVASGAVFPTVGRANPTLTIVALAVRLADHLKGRMQA